MNKQHQEDIIAQIKNHEAQKEFDKIEKKREQEDGVQAEEIFQDKLKKVNACLVMLRTGCEKAILRQNSFMIPLLQSDLRFVHTFA